MMRLRTTALIGSAALLAVCALAVQDTAKLVWKPKAGSTMKYRLTSEMNISGQAATFGGVMVMRTKEIKSDGKVVLTSTMESITFKMGDQDMSGMMPAEMIPVVTTVMNADGEMVSRDLDKPSEFDTPRLENALVLLYPKTELKIGDTWTRKHAGDKKNNIPPSQTTFTYKGKEMIADKFETYKIDVDFKELEGAAPMTSKSTLWLKADDGALLKGESVMKNVEVGQGMPPMDMTSKIIRISSEGG